MTIRLANAMKYFLNGKQLNQGQALSIEYKEGSFICDFSKYFIPEEDDMKDWIVDFLPGECITASNRFALTGIDWETREVHIETLNQ